MLFMNSGANRYVRADRRDFNVSVGSVARTIARSGSAGLQRGLDVMPRVHSKRTRHPDTKPTDNPNRELPARRPIPPTKSHRKTAWLPKQFPLHRSRGECEAANGAIAWNTTQTTSPAVALYAIERVGTRVCKPYQLVKRCCWRLDRSAAQSFTKCRATQDSRTAGVRISCLLDAPGAERIASNSSPLGSGRKSRLARPRLSRLPGELLPTRTPGLRSVSPQRRDSTSFVCNASRTSEP